MTQTAPASVSGPVRLTPAERRGRRIRVLHVITHLDHGGAQDNTLLTVAGLDEARYDVDIASGPGILAEHARAIAGEVHLLPNLRRPLLDPGVASTFVRLLSLCEGYDVVH